jgi:hypothetical protein
MLLRRLVRRCGGTRTRGLVAQTGMSRLFGWPGASTPPPAEQARWRAVLPPGLGGVCLGLLFLVAGLAPTGFSPTGPFHVGEHWGLGQALAARGVAVTTEPGIGYDGQWYLALAHDPLLLRQDLTSRFDNPRYRAGRPLQGWLGWLLAAGRPGAIPLGLLALGPLAVGLGGAATARILSAFGRSPAWGLGFALVPGMWAGIALATAEPLGLALAALGLSLLLDRRIGLAGLAFAGAALTKESYLAFAVAAGLHLLLDRSAAARARLRAAALALVPGLAALAGWWLYLVTRVPVYPDRGWVGVLVLPFTGWPRWLWALGHYQAPTVPDAPGRGGAMLVAGCLLLIGAGLGVGLLRRSLPARCGLVFGGYASLLGGVLPTQFFSTLRLLAPCCFAALLAVASGPMARRRLAVRRRREADRASVG